MSAGLPLNGHRKPVTGDWLMVSRVTKGKLGHLLEWGEGLFGQNRKLHLLGPMQEAIELPDWVEYHGPTNPEALAAEWFPKVCGLITLSSHDEGRPQVMIEAMAAGLPVLASDLPAHRDLLVDGRAGSLLRSPEELARMLNFLIIRRSACGSARLPEDGCAKKSVHGATALNASCWPTTISWRAHEFCLPASCLSVAAASSGVLWQRVSLPKGVKCMFCPERQHFRCRKAFRGILATRAIVQ